MNENYNCDACSDLGEVCPKCGTLGGCTCIDATPLVPCPYCRKESSKLIVWISLFAFLLLILLIFGVEFFPHA